MRNMILMFVAALATSVNAQPTIYSADNYSVGNKFIFKSCDADGVAPGAGGSSKTWNFSTLTWDNSLSTISILSPSSAPGSGSFPNASFVLCIDSNNYNYIHRKADTNFIIGYVNPVSGINSSYANSIIHIVRPLTYGFSCFDSFTTISKYGSQTYKGGGAHEIICDGYGSLVLPDSTYTSVLRVIKRQHQHDSITGMPGSFYTYTVSYLWYDTASTAPLLKIDSVETFNGNYKFQYVSYRPKLASSTGISLRDRGEGQFTVALYGSSLLLAGLPAAGDYDLKVYDVSAKQVLSRRITVYGTTYRDEVPDLQSGAYIIYIRKRDNSEWISNYKTFYFKSH